MNSEKVYLNKLLCTIKLIGVLIKKEICIMYKTSVPYSAAIVFILGAGLFFIGSDYWFNAGLSDFRAFFFNMPFLLCIIIPMLTMSLWADEKKQFTDKFLFSFPVSIRLIVIGKCLSLVCIWFCILVLSTFIPISVFNLVSFGKGSFFISYLAMFFFGAGIIAVSSALSSFSRHASINFLFSFLTVLFFTFIYSVIQKTLLPHVLKNIFRYISFSSHFESAARGIFDLRDFVFYILLALFGIELNVFIIYEQRNAK